MPGIWEALRDFRNPCSVLTKSPLLLRDLTLMQEIAAVTDIQREPVDPDARREGVAGERAAHAAPARADGGGGRAQPGRHPDRRAGRAADARDQRLARAGRGDPGVARTPARRASAASRCTCGARCAACSWSGCASYRPDLVERYEELYARGAYVPRDESERIQRLLRSAKRDPDTRLRRPVDARRHRANRKRRFGTVSAGSGRSRCFEEPRSNRLQQEALVETHGSEAVRDP